ncbi:uncharacterized protein SAPINGB_P004951 [Magnusiomyces paraingens]|uniref:Uncharacterized protein n=1 Tax=Magnusiomyces paraingens TaxID=2606893 RepID=A0A5E8BXS8_9ASCO|nr:uncharacterized protein SAPINGB_P004951 [Saprochaete ingens]VVT56307.1 unnamed protein product [Saprochaete ingens]
MGPKRKATKKGSSTASSSSKKPTKTQANTKQSNGSKVTRISSSSNPEVILLDQAPVHKVLTRINRTKRTSSKTTFPVDELQPFRSLRIPSKKGKTASFALDSMTDNDEPIGAIPLSQIEDDDGFVFVRKSGSVISSQEPLSRGQGRKLKSIAEPILEDEDEDEDQRTEEENVNEEEISTEKLLPKLTRVKMNAVSNINDALSRSRQKKKASIEDTHPTTLKSRKKANSIEELPSKASRNRRKKDISEEPLLRNESEEVSEEELPSPPRGRKRQMSLMEKPKLTRGAKKLRKNIEGVEMSSSDELLPTAPARRTRSAKTKTKQDDKEPTSISQLAREDSESVPNGTTLKGRGNQRVPVRKPEKTQRQTKSKSNQNSIDNKRREDTRQEGLLDQDELILLPDSSSEEDDELDLISSTKFVFPKTSKKRIKKHIEEEPFNEPTPEPSIHEEDVKMVDEVASSHSSPNLQEDINTTPTRPITTTTTTTTEENVEEDVPGHTTQITLPISDTPIIRRNQEMRRRISNSRRSSLGNRGKRASSIGNGFTAVPHSEVEPENFYKHLDHEAPDPHRMKQLLVWSSRRILEMQSEQYNKLKNSPELSTEERTALRIARVIQEEVVQDLSDGKISTSWWSRPTEDENEDTLTTKAPKKFKPNVLNIANRENLAIYRKKIQELRQERERWLAQIERVKSAAEGFKKFMVMTEQASNPDSSSKEGLTQALKRFAPEELERVITDYPVLDSGVGSSEVAAEKTISVVNGSIQEMNKSVDIFGDFAQKVQTVATASSAFSLGAIKDISLQLQREDEAVRYSKLQQQQQQRLQEKLLQGTGKERDNNGELLDDDGEERNLGSSGSNGSSIESDNESDEEGFDKNEISPETMGLAAHAQDSSLASVIIKSIQTKKILEQAEETTTISNDDMINEGLDDPLVSIQANEPHVRSILRTITRLEHVEPSP